LATKQKYNYSLFINQSRSSTPASLAMMPLYFTLKIEVEVIDR